MKQKDCEMEARERVGMLLLYDLSDNLEAIWLLKYLSSAAYRTHPYTCGLAMPLIAFVREELLVSLVAYLQPSFELLLRRVVIFVRGFLPTRICFVLTW